MNSHDGAEMTSTKSIVSPQSKQKGDKLPPEACISSSENDDESECATPQDNDNLTHWNHIAIDGTSHSQAQYEGSFAADDDLYYVQHENACKVCFKSFSSAHQLQIHSAAHDKQTHLDDGIFQKDPSDELISDECRVTKSHQCPTCLKTFCAPSKLQRHFLIHTGLKPFTCVQCGKAFRQETHLKSHLYAAHRTTSSQSDLEVNHGSARASETSTSFCPGLPAPAPSQSALHDSPPQRANPSVELELQCKISVSSSPDLDNSKQGNRGTINPGQSGNDKNVFSDAQSKSLGREQVPINGIRKVSKPFRCTFCGRAFRLELNLLRHWYTQHRKENPWQSCHPADDINAAALPVVNLTLLPSKEVTSPEPCVAAGSQLDVVVKPEAWGEDVKDFLIPNDNMPAAAPDPPSVTLQAPSQSRGTVSGSMRHQCHLCSKTFQATSKLQRHMMTHTDQRPFRCQMCEKSFRQETHLRVHSRTHLWSKYHRQRSFYIGRPLSRTAAHNTKPPVDVLAAKRPIDAFEKKSVTPTFPKMTHVQTLTLPNVQSSSCRLMPSTTYMNSTVNSAVISKGFLKKGQNYRSARIRNGSQHRCVMCFKCFPSPSKLRRHEMVHTGLKPFQCLLCGKRFRQAPHLKVHEKTHSEERSAAPVQQPDEQSPEPTTSREYNQEEYMTNSHGQFKHKSKGFTPKHGSPEFIDPREEETRKVPQPLYASGNDYLCNGMSPSFKLTDTNWQPKSEVDSRLEEDRDLEGVQKENCNDLVNIFPFELAPGFQKLVQTEGANPSSLQQAMGANTHQHFSGEALFQPSGYHAHSDDRSETRVAGTLRLMAEKQPWEEEDLTNNYWCEPPNPLDCNKCGKAFQTQQDARCHECDTGGQSKNNNNNSNNNSNNSSSNSSPAPKYRCDVCFKGFASPSKLERHYIIHTGQRPYRCHICSKTFTQSSHLRTHQKCHKL
ncbi:hypothetical protein NHX12_019476 [Muraenolepis orangiensis]|uniref:C2H2-type domain-containing protein n=1 Tax=Muraenolepis orangiensis TaxID=630683 RepID=A0A9Q0IXJ0_9TELE|nr:hypothetical protein NHX12_019476 [Muraenolepis orangiensis]